MKKQIAPFCIHPLICSQYDSLGIPERDISSTEFSPPHWLQQTGTHGYFYLCSLQNYQGIYNIPIKLNIIICRSLIFLHSIGQLYHNIYMLIYKGLCSFQDSECYFGIYKFNVFQKTL